MTRLPSLANPTISSVASGHEKGQSRKSAVDERRVSDTVNLTVEFGTLRDKRFPLMGNGTGVQSWVLLTLFATALAGRSEERRVGKECRYRWGADREKERE